MQPYNWEQTSKKSEISLIACSDTPIEAYNFLRLFSESGFGYVTSLFYKEPIARARKQFHESALGLNVVKALAEANNKTELYFYESPTDTSNKVRYYKDGSEWKFENTTNAGDIFSVEFDGTGKLL